MLFSRFLLSNAKKLQDGQKELQKLKEQESSLNEQLIRHETNARVYEEKAKAFNAHGTALSTSRRNHHLIAHLENEEANYRQYCI